MMERINDNSDPHKSRSMLFRLFSGDRGAVNEPDPSPEELQDNGIPADDLPAPDPVEADAPPEQPATPTEPANDGSEITTALQTEEIIVQPEPEGPPPPVDAGIEVRILQEGMEAYVLLTPPENGGNEASPKAIRTALKGAGVTYGILDRVMFEIAMSKPYNQGKILVAQGTPKEDGIDARVEEHFSREIDISPYQNADGTVDYKRLSIVREVKAGTVLATLIPHTDGANGINVKGETLQSKPGKSLLLLRGSNTVLSEDGLQLLAEKNGHLTYKDDRFHIATVFGVDGSVDNNTGNITFGGDVLIKGDVREGYTIRSGGSVRVKGVVEGGSVYADGDIVVDGGFNGMKRGELETGKSVTSKFLQNCTVRAKEDIKSGAVINSILFCDGQLTVTSDKGVIVGGRCTVLRSVEAKVIGTDVNTPTQIAVGLSPKIGRAHV